ncbi:conserved hypothetical protein [Bradyrhizobium sp. STM 3843]|uniref:imm11 family protein n=1 Tax=Bradyrhizobium sp. STM 3843 TaxID=551947 RepID=UPI00024043C5|nr:DUF1629 domain-containing protein [Bradyrhizobium sp. STM 3843]CCE11611.1 conserved hypothetical protein [Bradyrhizobium sp. STM 3843]
MREQAKDSPCGPRNYYTLKPDFNVKAPGHQWLNRAEQMAGWYPYPDQPFRGIRFSKPPQIRFDRKRGRTTLRDAAPFTLSSWLVTDRLKVLFERLDPEAFVFQKVDVDYSNFPEPGPDYWLVYFMRMLDCVDEEHSIIAYQDDLPGIKNYLGLIDVRMRSDIVGAAHAFRLIYADSTLIVDDIIVAALRAEQIRGFEFEPIQK